jgi:glutamine amidotransferase
MNTTPDVAVIDYGIGNLLSVRRGLEKCGASVEVTSDPAVILRAPRVVLPGVGAFERGMAGLIEHGLDQVVREVAAKGTKLLGICLGAQMLMDVSEEFGLTPGLGLIPGRVVQVPTTAMDGTPRKIPHIGWSGLVMPRGRDSWAGTLLSDVRPGEAVYFVHSFMANPENPEHRLSDCLYGGTPISAAIARGNVAGCQFHPEKSGETGLRILRRFLS